ncbi:recombinase family protein [Kitasatospora sp. NPDC059812]|uniref:recombinase family protein n=1 Tax=Kitasatospora sp. NPDC059812 TaxID=3346958 RepID=UPI003664C387
MATATKTTTARDTFGRPAVTAAPYKILDPNGDMDIYARKSVTRKGSRETELSVGQQIGDGINWGERNGYRPRYVWVDNGISGSKDVQRPGYDSGLAALESGTTRCLWSYKLDRFSRKGALAVLTIMDRLEGCRIFFGADNLDTANPKDRRMIMWRAEDAKEFSDQLSGRVADAWRYSKDQGFWLAPKAPYGLRKVKKTRKLKADDSPAIPGEIDGPTKADVVRRIIREAELGITGPKIAHGLNADRIPSSGGRRWTPTHVYKILKHPAYIGYQPSSDWDDREDPIHRDGKGRRVRVGEALVSEAQQKRARKKVSGRTALLGVKPTARGVRSIARSLLAGLLFCAGCGHVMIKQGASYACRHKLRAVGCDNPSSVQATAAELIVFEAWVSRLTASEPGDELLEAVAARWMAANRPDVVMDRKALQERVDDAKAALEDLFAARYKRKEFEGSAAEFYPGLLAESEAELESAEKALSAVPQRTADIGYLLDPILVQEAWGKATVEQKRELLALALDGVCARRKFAAGRTKVTPERFHFAWTGEPRTVEPEEEPAKLAKKQKKKAKKKAKAANSTEYTQAA